MISPSGGAFTYQYDGAMRLTALQNPQGDLTTFTYDAANRRTQKQLANGTVASFSYDAADRLTLLVNATTAGATLSSFAYQYDRTQNRVGLVDASGAVSTWTYDKTYQLTGEQRSLPGALDWVDFTLAQWQAFTLAEWQAFTLDASPGVYTTTYTYDPVGNRVLKNDGGTLTTSTYDAANQLATSVAATGVTTYVYDQAGNQRLIESPAGVTTSTWDDENRCKLTQLPSLQVDTFVYNGDGLRFEKQDSTGTTKFVWDGQAYLAETDAANALQAEYTSEPTQFGALVSQRRLTSGLWVPNYYHYDGLGSTAQLTSAGASVTDSYLYKAFGEPLLVNGTTINPFRWVGQVGYYFDPDTGNCYVRARIYDPVRARWLSQDPIGFWGRDSNLYRYVWNNPVNAVDPSGLVCCGPDVTAWFLQEVILFRAEADKLNAAREVDPTGNLAGETGGLYLGQELIRNLDARWLALKADYKERTFFAANCNATGNCERSVTLAGKCVGLNQLGNIMYGITSQRLDVVSNARMYGRTMGSYSDPWTAPGEQYRETAFDIGRLFEESGNSSGLMNLNPSAPVDTYYSNCKPCTQVWNGAHTDFTTPPLVQGGGQSAHPFRPPQQPPKPAPPTIPPLGPRRFWR